jgi:hypothetical protein
VKDIDFDAHIKILKKAIKADLETVEVDIINLFGFTLWKHLKMGWKFCTKSSQLHIWRVGVNILQKFLNNERWQRSLYAIEKPTTISRRIGRSSLQTFAS